MGVSSAATATANPSAWIELPHFAWERLTAQDAPTVRFAKGQTLFSQGDAVTRVHVIEQGRVRLVLLSASGHEKHMAIVGTNGMVGECSAFLDGRHSLSAVASSDVVTRQVDRRRLAAHMESDPVCMHQVLWLIGMKLRVIAVQNLLLSQASAAQRVAHHLVQLGDTYGEPLAGGEVAIRISFTHQEMANIAGLSRVMASNVLLQLQARAFIDKAKSHWVIRDIQALRQLAAGD
jgi:CRP/FNR family cyclic AMP-dependent transcriptional regulator